MAAGIGEVARGGDLDAVAGELDLEVRIGSEGGDLLADGGDAGDERGTGIGECGIVRIGGGEGREIVSGIGLVPVCFRLLELALDRGGVDLAGLVRRGLLGRR